LLLWSALGAIALVCAVAGAVFLGFQFFGVHKEISAEVDSLFEAISAGEFGETYATATAPEFRKVTTQDQYHQIGESVRTRLGPLQSKTLQQFNLRYLSGYKYATVAYAGQFQHGPGTIQAQFRSQSGDWLLVSFRVDSPLFLQDLPTAACPTCGKPHTESAKFCPHCGADLKRGEEKPVAEAE
ncbi:MAG: zinc-ribbon domain-containing protein, partial [Planctomycetaceae bacterium]